MADRPMQQSHTTALPDFVEETDLALSRFGGRICFATDDWFAAAENLLDHEEPIFIPDKFTAYGKWMDGWETRRKRTAGHDWCIIKLAFPGRILGVGVDTSFFTGNYVPRCSIQAASYIDDNEPIALQKLAAARTEVPGGDKIGSKASEEEMTLAASVHSDSWETILPFTPLGAGYKDTCHNYFAIEATERFTHLRLNMFPDGGIARLRVYGIVARAWHLVPATQVVDLAAVENGGKAIGCSDKHYGHPRNLINPGRGINMGDGWETARKLTRPPVLEPDEGGLIKVPGSDWAVLRLGTPGKVRELEIDTCWFKGNYPESCQVEAVELPLDMSNEDVHKAQELGEVPWRILLPRTKLGADQQAYFDVGAEGGRAEAGGAVTHLKLTIYPDGGISRVRARGTKVEV
ncbi:allantoicase [Nannochloropsis gaditana]|uniref:Allantoicase n=3 Tax=Nannochloropsis gaditana TaxID=72520 RepID=W7U1M7_9STRA|nr:allantoicase [Nannochloropsis gaditana]EWM26525.1 allantoicase [Nannochloropsis gaditana]